MRMHTHKHKKGESTAAIVYLLEGQKPMLAVGLR